MFSWFFVAYIVEGTVVFFLDLIVLLALCRHRELISRYCVIILQIFAAAVYALAAFIAGVMRITQLSKIDPDQHQTRGHCAMMPWNVLMIWTTESMLPVYDRIFGFIRMSAALLSILLYLTAFLLTRRYRKRIADMSDAGNVLRRFHRRQAQLTATMAISCIFTFVLYVIPVYVFYLSRNTKSALSGQINQFTVIAINLNSIPNISILYWRQQDIGNAVRRLFKCSKRGNTVAMSSMVTATARAVPKTTNAIWSHT
ncbi:unnamed protein product [Anisakis simplex]|uniref:G_PROTEIN_RECEP_F1_2 domain-containing protein n=1 Tax=Anisakis simplex TaxID=6269 RepID=A0A0M3JY77_ANISI|nr:unnamed protein product [Anisakis simplex]